MVPVSKTAELCLQTNENSEKEIEIVKFFLYDSKMVCEKCEVKLAKIVTPDPWKSGARNTTEGKSIFL